MSTFKALNVESDDESDVEIDDTKELQVEEALKLYQVAVKHHADGPASYPEASAAYKALLQSDIFKYPESQAELRRIELLGPVQVQNELLDEAVDTTSAPVFYGDSAPSTLPQIVHLAHKNYGDFLLDELRQNSISKSLSWEEVRYAAVAAIDHFVEALDKDDSDLDVWKQTSLVGSLLGSKRVARFCLEALLDDDDLINDPLGFSGLEETSAGKGLCHLATELQDVLSLHQGPLDHLKRRQLKKLLLHRLSGAVEREDVTSLAIQQTNTLQEKVENLSLVKKLPAVATWADLTAVLADVSTTALSDTDAGLYTGLVSFEGSPVPAGNESSSPAMQMNAMIKDAASLPDPANLELVFPGMDHPMPLAILPKVEAAPTITKRRQTIDAHVGLPTRKRSSEVAGNDTPDTGRIKSKRLRARESLVEGSSLLEDGIANGVKVKQDVYAELTQNDTWCFASADFFLEAVGIETFSGLANSRPKLHVDHVDSRVSSDDPTIQDLFDLAAIDLYSVFAETPDRLVRPHQWPMVNRDIEVKEPHLQLLSALEQDNSASNFLDSSQSIDQRAYLDDFLAMLNSTPLVVSEAAFCLVQLLLGPSMSLKPLLEPSKTSYTSHKWPAQLKDSVVRILTAHNDYIASCIARMIQDHEDPRSPSTASQMSCTEFMSLGSIAELTESIFELQLELFSRCKYASVADASIIIMEQQSRVEQWSELARRIITLHRAQVDVHVDRIDELTLRYTWSSTEQMKLAESVDKPTILSYYQELRAILVDCSGRSIALPNNTFMAQLSVQSIDAQIAKLTTHDFFHKVFGSDKSDAVSIIETLEPILDHVHARKYEDFTSALHNTNEHSDDHGTDHDSDKAPPAPSELIDFLCKSSTPAIIVLWQRLRSAYQEIEYNPMVIVCHFKIIEALVFEFAFASQCNHDQEDRQDQILQAMLKIHESLLEVLEIAKVATDLMECMDTKRLRVLILVLVKLLKVLQYANFAQDEVTQQERPPPFERPDATRTDATRAKTLRINMESVQDAQLSSWVVFYMAAMEIAKQDPDRFPQPALDGQRMDLLRAVHTSVGHRGFCSGANRILLNLLKKELPSLKHVPGYEFEFSQLLHDLYDLNCFVHPAWELLPHQCSRDVSLDRAAAVQAVDLILKQVAKIKPTELNKHPIKDAIEKVHIVVARKKPTEDILRNRDLYKHFFQLPIRPLDLFRCLKGDGQVNLVTVANKTAALADQGWYFLMGNMALARWRSQKRTSPGPTDDLDTAISYLSQDLEYGSEKWETWFRLAQAYDARIEDNVTWNAERLNNNMLELAQLQRSAIHCYMMAMALSQRIEEPEFESSAKIAELCADFGMRMYASSRPPFSMQAFALQGAVRYLSTTTIVKVPSFKSLNEHQAVKFARVLFQRAIAGNPNKWFLHFMEARCMWKMYYVTGLGEKNLPTLPEVLASYQRAIELLPAERKDKKEPILEPHYKLLTMVHKVMSMGRRFGYHEPGMTPAEACAALAISSYSRKVAPCEDIEEWDGYVLNVLKQLRHADKANWHHRMIARSAKVIFGERPEGVKADLSAAIGARYELTQQLFTKTMVLQVWRPELERAGRHFLYTVEYTRLFMEVLTRCNDKPALELLVRRVCRRKNEYFGHAELWTDLAEAYLEQIRLIGCYRAYDEENCFGLMEFSEFKKRKEMLEAYLRHQAAKPQEERELNKPLNLLRDVMEFKKLSAGMGKIALLDETIGEAYARVFDDTGEPLWEAHLEKQAEQAAQQQRTMTNLNNMITGGPALPQADGMELDATDTTTGAAETTPVKRKIGIGRREIRNSAEALVAIFNETVAAPEPALPKLQAHVVLERRASGFSAVEYSVHDSADESELSDVDEDVIQQEGQREGSAGGAPAGIGMDTGTSMFPGLMIAPASRPGDAEDEDAYAGKQDGEDGEGGKGDHGGYDGEEEGNEADVVMGQDRVDGSATAATIAG